MKTRYGHTPWIEGFPETRRPTFEPLRRDMSVDVAIVGGGLTGLATAHALAAAGLRPLLLEAARIGQASAGRGTGLLIAEPGPSFRDLVRHHGLRATRILLEAWRKAAADVPGQLRRAGIQCELAAVEDVVAGPAHAERELRRDHEAREAAGFDSQWLEGKRMQQLTRADGLAGMRLRGGSSLDPHKLCIGLARAAVRNRARIFEKSNVEAITPRATDVEIVVKGGVVHASTVIIATGAATRLFKPLQRHFTDRERYVVMTEPVPATMRRQLFDDAVALCVARTPALRARWTSDHRLLISGGDQPATTVAKRPQTLVQRTGQLMYELLLLYPAISGLRPEFGWEASYGETADGVMYIGAHRNYPRHLFALGGGGESVASAFVAAKVLTRAVKGEPAKTDQVFGWTR